MSLRERLADLIRQSGPISVAQYMTACLHDPVDGYYATRPALGAAGDFITAPLVSQMFGEMIGLWLVETWARLGRPNPVRLVELGPGDGTLMSDMLRAARVAPEFLAATEVWLVDVSEPLIARQKARLGSGPRWANALAEVPKGAPLLIVANEVLDCLPVQQFVRTEGGWAERRVRLDKTGALTFGLAGAPPTMGEAPVGAVREVSPAQEAMGAEIGRRIAHDGGVALLIDYGRAEPEFSDTLQALRRHEKVCPLACPGEADLTVHADFPAVLAAARREGAQGAILTQAQLLQRLGVETRAAALARSRPDRADEIERQLDRLIGADQMGVLFKAAAIHQDGLVPPGFEADLSDLRVLTSPLLELDGVQHAFFTRQGGVSEGIYDSLNLGLGSGDDPGRVLQNRRRAAAHMGVEVDRLLTNYQIHSADAVTAEGPWVGERPQADALVTRTVGVACGALAADCAPILIADPQARVVAAVHAGWKGALAGVAESAITRMVELGATRQRMTAVVGPCIGPASYEVGLEFLERFTTDEAANADFFASGASQEKRLFDLPSFVLHRLRRAGVMRCEWVGRDTCTEAPLFYSNRRAFKAGEPDFGRLLSAIVLT